MPSLLRTRTAFRCFSLGLLLSAALDALSTVYACHSAGTWDVEANPVFRGFGQAASGHVSPLVLLWGMKALTVGLSLLWLRLTLSLVPGLYPQLGRELGFVQFVNFLFCGIEARGWRALFLVPRANRLYRGLSVPVTVVIILGGLAASVVNTFQLLRDSSEVVIFWGCVAGFGALVGFEMLRRDFLRLSRTAAKS